MNKFLVTLLVLFLGCNSTDPSLVGVNFRDEMRSFVGEISIYAKDVNPNFDAGRYHSLIIDSASITDELEITSQTEEGIIMGVKHRTYPIEGIQFHPESILTPEGELIIKNWLEQ